MRKFKISRKKDWHSAGPNDLIEILVPPGQHPLFYRKKNLHLLTLAIADRGCLHISGGSGTGKTSLLFALTKMPKNWSLLCKYHDLAPLPLRPFHVAGFNYESPSELWYRRSIDQDGTYDEEQKLVDFLRESIAKTDEAYYLLHLMELGRTRSEIQHAYVHLIEKNDLIDPLKGESMGVLNLAVVADSNYAAAHQFEFLLAEQDTALFNRINESAIKIDHLSADEESAILKEIKCHLGAEEVPDALIEKITDLGNMIRTEQLENGALSSVSPVSMRQYISFLKKAVRSPLPPEELVDATLLALASDEDLETISELKARVFGAKSYTERNHQFDDIAFL